MYWVLKTTYLVSCSKLHLIIKKTRNREFFS